MYEEPYRWIEAVGNRRQYLDDQFKQGSPIVALSYDTGILILTVSRGTPKVYEIYDRIALGGMGHPADLEKLRFQLLDMAHLEGFNRSPSDVTGARLLKNGLAPTVKQAFEEIFKAPFITKILLAELGETLERNQFLTIDYDGTFEETKTCAVVAGTLSIQAQLSEEISSRIETTELSLEEAIDLAARVWAKGSLLHTAILSDVTSNGKTTEAQEGDSRKTDFDAEEVVAHLRQTLVHSTLECRLLDRTISGSSKYRVLSNDEVSTLLPTPMPSAQ
ncbi:MAG: proteasome subunit alpha [Nitrospirales bacterium]|nr:MAG: proteasome subunit alpha [Nitrospirales bacterium]